MATLAWPCSGFRGKTCPRQAWAWHPTRYSESETALTPAVVEAGGKAFDAMQGFHKVLGGCDMLANLSVMAPRLKELRRVLKPAWQPLPALRRNRKPLPESPDGPRFHGQALQKRNRLEAVQRTFGHKARDEAL